jgi:hypothetical protein
MKAGDSIVFTVKSPIPSECFQDKPGTITKVLQEDPPICEVEVSGRYVCPDNPQRSYRAAGRYTVGCFGGQWECGMESRLAAGAVAGARRQAV